MSEREPDFLYKPGENTAFRASLVEHWPSHYKKEMTGKLYMQSEPVMVNGLIEAETNATASVAGLTIDVPDTLMVGQSQAFCENFRAGRIHVSAPAPSGQAWGWAIVDKNGDEVDTRARFTAFFGAVNHEEEPFDAEWLASRDREFPGLAPHRVVTLYTSPQPAGQAAAGVQRDFRAVGWMRSDGSLHKGCPPLDEPSGWVAIGEIIPAPAVERGVEEEREAFEAALKQTWKMVDPLKPCGQPGSYARGEYNGICAALTTVRENFARALSTAGKEQA